VRARLLGGARRLGLVGDGRARGGEHDEQRRRRREPLQSHFTELDGGGGAVVLAGGVDTTGAPTTRLQLFVPAVASD
jgi:hypothetical protein